jgi:hypothetical protein
MSIYSIQCRDDNDNLVWDSYDAVGGVVADVRVVAAGATGSWTYPAFVGKSAVALNIQGSSYNDFNVSTDTDLGYPRVTAGAYNVSLGPRKIMVIVR